MSNSRFVQVRCGRCRRRLDQLERYPGRWLIRAGPDSPLNGNSKTSPDGLLRWDCKCGLSVPVNSERLSQAADDVADRGGRREVFIGVPNYGVPQR